MDFLAFLDKIRKLGGFTVCDSDWNELAENAELDSVQGFIEPDEYLDATEEQPKRKDKI